MPASNPSPPGPASATVMGLVSLAAQTMGQGVKTFTSLLVASAGIQLALLFNTNGTGASDVGVKVGVSPPDGTVNAAAKPLSVRTGLGGTEVEKAYFRKAGSLVASADTANPVGLGTAADLANVCDGFKYNVPGAEIGVYSSNNASFLGLNLGTGGARSSGAFTSGGLLTGTGLSLSVAPPLTSATGTPGATVTQAADKGRITVPSGATSVVVTNSSVSANSFVSIEWEALPGVTHSVSYAAGSFTVTFSAALGSSLTFRYFVVR
jgi:hypothetical protein